jgi:hypothetical protein
VTHISTRAVLARHVILLGVLLAAGGGIGAAKAQPVQLVLNGSYHTTVVQRGRVAANNYNDPNAQVTVTYNIPIISNGQTMMKEFDLANATVTFSYLFNGAPFTTVAIPITSVQGNPNTGTISSFTFYSEQWDPARPAQNNGIDGEIDVANGTGNIESGYTSGGQNPTITQYTFDTQDARPAQPRMNPQNNGQPIEDTSTAPGSGGISYDASTGLLSISGDTITGTPDPSDPLLGASVNFSQYQFEGFTSDGTLAIFWPTADNGPLTVTEGGNVLEQSDLPVLYYDVADNLFYGAPLDVTLAGVPSTSPFYDPSLASIASPYLASIEDVLDPASPDYDPLAYLYETISPDGDFDTLTNGFSTSAGTDAADAEFVADVPEPSAVAIFAAALTGLLLRRGRRPRLMQPGSTIGRAIA